LQRILFASTLLLALTGCATYSPSIPADYTGPKASVKDTTTVYSVSKADLFYVSHVDGLEIENSRIVTRKVNHGRGMYMEPQALTNQIPAKNVTLTIVGRTEYAAPILALTNTVYQLKGTVEFTPEANKSYVVRGKLDEAYSAVWIEDAETNSLVGKKVELHGSAKLGTFQK
jgi:hypothetical protein